ncbi:MAG: calcium/sodium antiporter [Rhodospirillales bacterium]|nr:calcium/sodium antiporter [Rhodospirillales bacterium]MCB9996147.1 calcium/sodium antiporter [Rhodospirillales bacterium]
MLDCTSLSTSEAFILALGALGLGMIMLIRGGNWTIDAAIYIARHLGVSPLVVGFTIIAFGTSLPELVVSVNANVHNLPGIAIGNVLGSNIANILLVLGATGLFATIIAVPRELMRDLILMLVSTALLAGLMVHGFVSFSAGAGMVAVLLGYTLWKYRKAISGEVAVEDVDEPEFSSMALSVLFLVIGLVFIALGAEMLVRGAKVSAGIIGVPEDVIGLTVIAIGTSLPELSTCLIAARKNQTGLILGNIIGSNVFNILMIIGVMALVKPIDLSLASPQLVNLDIWVTLGVSCLFTLLLLLYRKVDKRIGVLFLGGYTAYMLSIFLMYMN